MFYVFVHDSSARKAAKIELQQARDDAVREMSWANVVAACGSPRLMSKMAMPFFSMSAKCKPTQDGDIDDTGMLLRLPVGDQFAVGASLPAQSYLGWDL